MPTSVSHRSQASFFNAAGGHSGNTRLQAEHGETVLVVNPNSCSGLTGKNWLSLRRRIRRAMGEKAEAVFTKQTGDATVLTRALLKQGSKKIIAIGGDGTINEVANGFFEEPAGGSEPRLKRISPDSVMGIVPCGTRNVLARSLGLPESIVECCRNFTVGRPKKIDVIVASVMAQDRKSWRSRVYLNAAEIGLGAEIIERSRKVRRVVNSRTVSTVTGILATLLSYQSNQCEIILDGRRNLVNMTMTIVANGKFLAGGFKAAPKAKMSDGVMDVVVIKDSGSLKMLDEFFSMKSGNYDNDANVLYEQCRKVSIKSKERNVTVTADGETIGILPATFSIKHRALNIRI